MQPLYGTDRKGNPHPLRTTAQGRILLPPWLYATLAIVSLELGAILLVLIALLQR